MPPTQVELYVRESLAANTTAQVAAGNMRRVDQIRAIRMALHWLTAALALDPTRSDLVWKNQPPLDAAALTNRQIAFYVFVIGLADTGRYYLEP